MAHLSKPFDDLLGRQVHHLPSMAEQPWIFNHDSGSLFDEDEKLRNCLDLPLFRWLQNNATSSWIWSTTLVEVFEHGQLIDYRRVYWIGLASRHDAIMLKLARTDVTHCHDVCNLVV